MALRSFFLNRVEPYVHGVSMKGLKAGVAALPFRWPKTFDGGEEPLLQMCRYLSSRKHRSILLVTSKAPVRNGLIDPVVRELESAGIKLAIHDQIKPDPTVEDIEAAVTVLKKNQCDGVLAIGGGSCIDAAKVVAARGRNDKSILKLAGMFRVTMGMLPLYAAPTTAGTGSEVTIAAVVTDVEGKRKLPIMDPRLMPRAAALDGNLMIGVPRDTTAATGMDALTHAVEAFVSLNASKATNKLALEATRLIMANLEAVVADGKNLEARQNMARAAYLAGKAFTQAGVGYVHAIAHNFGALYHVPHGRANAIVMPHVLEHALPVSARRLARLARESGIGDEKISAEQRAQLFIERIREMNESFGIPTQLKELKKADVPAIATAARAEARFTYAVPRYMRQSTCERIVSQMLCT